MRWVVIGLIGLSGLPLVVSGLGAGHDRPSERVQALRDDPLADYVPAGARPDLDIDGNEHGPSQFSFGADNPASVLRTFELGSSADLAQTFETAWGRRPPERRPATTVSPVPATG